MFSQDQSFFGRIEDFNRMFGEGGAAILLLGLILAGLIAMWRGTGLLLFVLFLSYSVAAISYGGVIFAATLARWGVLAALLVLMVAHFRFPRPAVFLFMAYALLGLLFTPWSPAPYWSLQRGGLLLLAIINLACGRNQLSQDARGCSSAIQDGHCCRHRGGHHQPGVPE